MTLFGDAGFEVKRRAFDKLQEFLTTREISSYKKLAFMTDNASLLSFALHFADHLMSIEYDHNNDDHRNLREALDKLIEKIEMAK